MNLRNAWKRGLEYYPVPNGVCLNSSGNKNALNVSCSSINSDGVYLVSAVKKQIFGMAVCVDEGLLWSVRWDESLIMLR